MNSTTRLFFTMSSIRFCTSLMGPPCQWSMPRLYPSGSNLTAESETVGHAQAHHRLQPQVAQGVADAEPTAQDSAQPDRRAQALRRHPDVGAEAPVAVGAAAVVADAEVGPGAARLAVRRTDRRP